MQKQTQRVELIVQNTPGVLGRVISHIRHEGWNIKYLLVDESENEEISEMAIDIEGTHTKLAQVVERLFHLDCVLKVTMTQGETVLVKERDLSEFVPEGSPAEKAPDIPEKTENTYRILTINPGSTSTKYAIYDNETLVFTHTLRHDQEEISQYPSVLAQKQMRKNSIVDALVAAGIPLHSLDAISGRGGLLKPIESGTYIINEVMLRELHTATASIHASALGAILASEIAADLQIPAFVVDPIVVDEMDRYAKLTGMPGIERSSVFHALNQKAIARRVAEELHKPYESLRFVVAHLGGGITVGAHRYGRVIDVNDALSGEGPFTPERTGSLPVAPIIDMCFSGEYTKAEMLEKISKKGGMLAYLGTNDLRNAQKMINEGDDFAALVLDSMAYQVCKEIGAMVTVLESRVDAIILTGGLAYSNRFTGSIKQRVDRLAPVYVYPGEDEMLALMQGVLRVLTGEEMAMEYE